MWHELDPTLKLNLSNTRSGWKVIELIIVIFITLVVIVISVLPRLARSKKTAPRINCAGNLKQVGVAYQQWAIDHGDKYPMSVSVTNGGVMEYIESGVVWPTFSVMSNELNTPKLLFCPQETDRKRVMATTFVQSVPLGQSGTRLIGETNVSYFVGLDADPTEPLRILSGDDNFLVGGVKPKPGILLLWTNSPVAWTKDRHVNQGNIGLADGSVMVVSTPKLREALVNTGMATNRLAMP
jgi:prepilin-type processing-associated H-X9-DG protein